MANKFFREYFTRTKASPLKVHNINFWMVAIIYLSNLKNHILRKVMQQYASPEEIKPSINRRNSKKSKTHHAIILFLESVVKNVFVVFISIHPWKIWCELLRGIGCVAVIFSLPLIPFSCVNCPRILEENDSRVKYYSLLANKSRNYLSSWVSANQKWRAVLMNVVKSCLLAMKKEKRAW